MKKGLILSVIFAFTCAISDAQVKYSNEFLSLGVGARGLGMSNAQAASVDDVTSGYWNPAGLTSVTAPIQISFMHAEWFAGIAGFDYLSVAKTINAEKNSVVGLSFLRFGIDHIPYTINLVGPDGSINYDNVTEFSAADYAFIGSYAQTLRNKKISVGGNVKVVRRVIGRFGKSWGFGLDAGIQYKGDHWRFGLMCQDISTTFNAWSFHLSDQEKTVFTQTGNEIPVSSVEITRPKFIVGAAYVLNIANKTTLLSEIDLDFTTDGQRNVLISSPTLNIDPHLGLELNYHSFVFLRVGVGKIQKALDDISGSKKIYTVQPNFGIGLKLGRFALDYAYTDVGNLSQVQYSHIFSIRLDIKGKDKNK